MLLKKSSETFRHTRFLQVCDENSPRVNCSCPTLETKPQEGFVFYFFFSPLKHNVLEQHVGHRPCCVADGFFCLLKVANWYKTSLFFIAANFSQSWTGCSQSHQNLCKHGRLTFPLTDGPWGIAVELPVSFHVFWYSQDACKKVFEFALCVCLRMMLRSLWWQICMQASLTGHTFGACVQICVGSVLKFPGTICSVTYVPWKRHRSHQSGM